MVLPSVIAPHITGLSGGMSDFPSLERKQWGRFQINSWDIFSILIFSTMLNDDYLLQLMPEPGSQKLRATVQSLAKHKPCCVNIVHLGLQSLVQSFLPCFWRGYHPKQGGKSLRRLLADRIQDSYSERLSLVLREKKITT